MNYKLKNYFCTIVNKIGGIFALVLTSSERYLMSNRILGFIVLLLFSGMVFFTSCASRKDLIYFQADSIQLNTSYELNTPKLQPGDILTISVTADDVRATQPFNQISQYNMGTLQANNPYTTTYAIDSKGEIDFPKLGKIKLAGKTRT